MTQRAIKQVLTERFYSWRDAESIAKDDPEVNLSGDGPAYIPGEFGEGDILEEEQFEAAEGVDDLQGQKVLEPEVIPEGKPESRPNV